MANMQLISSIEKQFIGIWLKTEQQQNRRLKS